MYEVVHNGGCGGKEALLFNSMPSATSAAARALVLVLLFPALFAGEAGAQTPIGNCTTISAPGEYVLNTSIMNNPPTCINITSSNVILDGAGNTIDGTDVWSSFGVYVYNSTIVLSNVTVKNLKATDWGYGIYYNNTSNGSVANSTASSNVVGINLHSSNYSALIDNNASSNGGIGIWLLDSNNNTLRNNTASSNRHGITLSSSIENTLTNNAVSNSEYGIALFSSHNNTLMNNTAGSNNLTGIHLETADNNTLINNNASSHNYYGITLFVSDDNALTNNTASSNNYSGISLQYASRNILINNNASSNNYGIYVLYSQSNTLYNNTFTGNRYNFHLDGNQDPEFNNSIDTSNKVDGKPIFYIKNSSNTTYDGSGNAGTFYCIWCNNVTIKDLPLTKNDVGVFFWGTDNSKIENVNSSLNNYGIRLYSSSNNTLTNNNASSSNYGIYLGNSNNNTLTNNTANTNSLAGIYLSFSNNNAIYNNRFNNTNNFGFGTIGSNIWNITKQAGTNIGGGSYLGGNFWANPSGTGFSETCMDVDRDGICDLNYTLASGNIDYLPLAAAPGQINSCTAISSPGSYTLVQNITNSSASACINITLSNVTFDGAGYTIDGNDTLNTLGVYVFNSSTALTNVTVKNLVVTDWYFGIHYSNAENGSITNNTASSNMVGIDLASSSNNNLTNNTATFNSDNGIHLGNISKNNIISGNNASNNLLNGISIGNNSNNTVVKNNIANSNKNNGIGSWDSSNQRITNNTAKNNGGSIYQNSGIYLYNSNDCTITNTIVASNGRDFYSINSSSNTIITNLFTNTRASFTYAGDLMVNSSSSPASAPAGYRNIGKFLNITNASTAAWIYLNISYTDEEATSVTESTLRMWKHNGSWSMADGMNGVETALNYIYANITSFSIFAPLGEAQAQTSPLPAATGTYKPRVVILANSIDRNHSAQFYGYLRELGIEVIEITLANFDSYKNARFIIILGGPDASEGIGQMVRGMLADDEQKFLRTKGNRRMYMKTNIWRSGQIVRIIAGSNREQTAIECIENEEDLGRRIKYNLD